MLSSGNGRPMIVEAISKLEVSFDDVVITILKEHDEKYGAKAGLRSAFGRAVEVVVLDSPTASQPETITRTLTQTGLSEPFLIKDSDNSFALAEIDQPYNYVSSASLNDFSSINPQNKSYIKADESEVITQIREKQVISHLFSVGGYFFRSPADYVRTYEKLVEERLPWQAELYTSDIIASLIFEGDLFKARNVTEYQDWGTLKEWSANLQKRSTYFVLLDGFILEKGNAYFGTSFSDVTANEEAVAIARDLVAEGHKLVFLSIRPESARGETEKQLRGLELPTSDILFEMPVGRYMVISAPDPAVPFTSARGLELAPNDPRLGMKLRFQD
jgi:NDP-sugar pyrophosphorylase family protein